MENYELFAADYFKIQVNFSSSWWSQKAKSFGTVCRVKEFLLHLDYLSDFWLISQVRKIWIAASYFEDLFDSFGLHNSETGLFLLGIARAFIAVCLDFT